MGSIISSCRIKDNSIFKDEKVALSQPGISLDDFLLKAYENLNAMYPKFYKMDRLSKLGFLGSEVLRSGRIKSENTSVILSNGSSSLDTDIKFWDSAKTAASPSLFVYTLPNIVAGEICIRNGFKGESNFFVTPFFDADWIVSYVEQMLQAGVIEICLAGWVEVLADQADVFLYLADNSGAGMEHSAENVRELYHGRTGLKS